MGVLRKWDVDKVAVGSTVYFGVSFKIVNFNGNFVMMPILYCLLPSKGPGSSDIILLISDFTLSGSEENKNTKYAVIKLRLLL